jgi:hypothetical protein
MGREVLNGEIVNICQQKTVLGGKRHVIVMNIVDKLKSNIALAIKSIINKYTNNALFIVRNDNGVHIDEHLVASCLTVRLVFDHELFAADFANATGKKITTFTDPMNMCIALDLPAGADLDPLQHFVSHHMTHMLNLLAKGDTTVDTYGKALRDFCIKVGASCIPIATLGHCILAWLEKRGNVDVSDYVGSVAQMEHMTKCVTKPLFALELKIDEIVQRLHSK